MTRKLVALALGGVLAAGAAGAWAVVRRPAPGPPVEVFVDPGQTTTQIASRLASHEVIGSTLGFRLWAKVRGLDGSIRAGRYQLRRGMGVVAALDVMSRGAVERSVRVTIPEGFTVRQIASRLGRRTHLGQDEVAAAAAASRAPIMPAGVTTPEGLLFPDTYVIPERETAVELVARMIRTFDERTAGLDWAAADARKVSRYEVVIIASLVEREARVPEDREKISAVIYNRLRKEMRLQIDATALYGLPEHKVPTRKDLQRATPYNTYLHDGLPPTPIANPGLEAIEAALHPAAIDALYYVVIDPSGRHGFTASPDEFERLKRLRPPETTGRRS